MINIDTKGKFALAMCCWRHLRSPHRLSIQRPQMGNLQRLTCLEIAYAPPILLLQIDIKDLVCMCTTLKTNFSAKIIRLCWNHKSNQDSASVNKAASHPCRQRQWPLDEPLALSITPLWHPLSAVTDEKSRNDMNYDEWNKDFCRKYFKCKFDVCIFQICSSPGALTKAIKW